MGLGKGLNCLWSVSLGLGGSLPTPRPGRERTNEVRPHLLCSFARNARRDLVLSRDEHDPLGLVVAQRVEEVFVREGLIWELRLGGQVIRTTAEHPFYHETRGWLACHHLQVGDKLLCEDGRFVVLEGIRDTGDWETVYNLRIAEFHTYFVGCDEWGWAVWAHNAACTPEMVREALADAGLPALRTSSVAKVRSLVDAGDLEGAAAFLRTKGASPEQAQNAVRGLFNRTDDATIASATAVRQQEQAVMAAEAAMGRPRLPEFDGTSTRGVLVTREGVVIPLESGGLHPNYLNYPASGHVEGRAAIAIRESGSTGGTVYHNHPSGTCGFCHAQIPTLLPERVPLRVVPPANAVAPNWTWHIQLEPYLGNSAVPRRIVPGG
jgi:hypothetical protein